MLIYICAGSAIHPWAELSCVYRWMSMEGGHSKAR